MSTLAPPRRLLALDAAAWLIGTSGSNLSNYRIGRRRPGPLVASRIAALDALTPESAFVSRSHPLRAVSMNTGPSLAVSIRRELRETGTVDLDWALSRMGECYGRLRWFSATDSALVLAAPSTTGDVRYDTLLAGAARHWCDRLGLPRPEWTGVPPLDEEWDPYPAFREWSLRRPDEDLLSLRVLLREGGFEKA